MINLELTHLSRPKAPHRLCKHWYAATSTVSLTQLTGFRLCKDIENVNVKILNLIIKTPILLYPEFKCIGLFIFKFHNK